ncbi:hypothetical protein [Halomontanus rarus]|uniref:hypothetical protein n=1 Tax=Halomontanus rarus TaxID=3034020 RepID=UPI00307CBEC5
MRQIIESRGRFDWQLAVCNDDVTASFHYPGEPSIYLTTADFGLGYHDPGEDGCEVGHVVSEYRRRSQTETATGKLLERTLAALTDDHETVEPTREVVA